MRTAFLVSALALVFAMSLMLGSTRLTGVEAIIALFARDAGSAGLIMTEIRLPRALLGLLVGGILGLAGAALQGFLRNPLAEPGVTGVSGGAALAAVIALYSGFSEVSLLALPVAGILGGALAALFLVLLAGRGTDETTLILAGVALNALAASLTALMLSLSRDPQAALEITFWLMGSLSDRSLVHVYLAAPFIVLGGILLLQTCSSLDGLSLGAEVACSLGVNPRRLRRLLIAGTALGVGAATAVTGMVAFVGLMAPHLVRPWVGHVPSRTLGASTWCGAMLVLFADILARTFPAGSELKLGVVTSLLGAPFLLALILRRVQGDP